MTERSSGDRTRESAPQTPMAAPSQFGGRPCPHCGAHNHPDATVCQECGEPLRVRARDIRCRHCGMRAPSNLVICPGCARELHAAPSRWVSFGAPIAVVGLFLLVLVGRTQQSPLQFVRDIVGRGAGAVTGLSTEMDPTTGLEMTPIVDTAAREESAPATPPTQLTDGAATTQSDGTADSATTTDDQAAEQAVALLAPTDTPAAVNEPTATPTAEPTATVAPTATSAPTATATSTSTSTSTPPPTATAQPTATSQPTSTPTAADAAQGTAVRSSTADGNVLLPTPTSAATATVTATDDENAGDDEATGDAESVALALIPTATPTREPSATPTPATYTVQPGDTLVVIAARLDVTADALRIANNLSAEDLRRLRPGQLLLIPDGEPANAASPTSVAVAQATAAPTDTPIPAATPVPTATPVPAPALRLDAPQLRSPENDATVGCSANNTLTWEGVNFIQPNDQYIMHLGFVSGIDGAGNESVTWVLRQPRPANRTSWDMDNDLCALAPQEYGRQWRWYVEVVDEQGEAVSPPSETWRLSWN